MILDFSEQAHIRGAIAAGEGLVTLRITGVGVESSHIVSHLERMLVHYSGSPIRSDPTPTP